jgi:hypothetical protein
MLHHRPWLHHAHTTRMWYRAGRRHISSLFHMAPPFPLPVLSDQNVTTKLTAAAFQQQRWFHVTSRHHLAVQRRRKRDPAGILERKAGTELEDHHTKKKNGTDELWSGDAERENNLPNITTEEFRTQSSHLISRIHAALVSLESINPNMLLSGTN